MPTRPLFGTVETAAITDSVLVSFSGGKDSVALLTALAWMRSYLGIDYSLAGLVREALSACGGLLHVLREGALLPGTDLPLL